jgi:hypothetical protein
MRPIRNFPGNGWNEKTETRREDILEAAETMLFLPNTNNKRRDIEDLSGIVAFIRKGERESFCSLARVQFVTI